MQNYPFGLSFTQALIYKQYNVLVFTQAASFFTQAAKNHMATDY
jgi:hypothetical protein